MDRFWIAVWACDQSGVLQRITGLCARRGFNLASVTVGPSGEEGISRITLAMHGTPADRDRVIDQLSQLVDVSRIQPLNRNNAISRELALIKVSATAARRPEIMALADTFHCGVVDVGRESLTVEAAGESSAIQAIISLFRPYGILELSRTGETSIERSLCPQTWD